MVLERSPLLCSRQWLRDSGALNRLGTMVQPICVSPPTTTEIHLPQRKRKLGPHSLMIQRPEYFFRRPRVHKLPICRLQVRFRSCNHKPRRAEIASPNRQSYLGRNLPSVSLILFLGRMFAAKVPTEAVVCISNQRTLISTSRFAAMHLTTSNNRRRCSELLYRRQRSVKWEPTRCNSQPSTLIFHSNMKIMPEKNLGPFCISEGLDNLENNDRQVQRAQSRGPNIAATSH